ncbi:MAG: hypothetical protein KDC18_04880 [Alphaproteobacteria bacterium]|nr:hypothetical protein [Alphaproteobacteria bacterium]MCB9929550.1 hypothetical protein [Alphaproteobacteria bacterium]
MTEGEGAPAEDAGPKKWNVRNVMSWGVIVGPAVLYGYNRVFPPADGAGDIDFMVYVIGGGIGGALAFTAIAAIRNALVK